jgi:hypothetical protein
MSIKIRAAKEQDAEFLAMMMLQSSRAGKKVGIFDLLFKDNDEVAILQKLQKLTHTQAKSQCHYKNFLVAELDGQLVGSLCSYEPRISNHETFVEALLEIGCTQEDITETLEVMNDCDFELNRSTLMFDFMEELEGFVDVGVLKALMQKSLLTARLKGYGRAQTIIEIGSLETELFYKKLGFKLIEEKECESYRELFGRNGLMLLSIEF